MTTLPDLPDEAWTKIVEVACGTFRELLMPVTATTGGLGRIIKTKFDILEAGMRESAISLLGRVNEKLSESEHAKYNKPKRKVVLDAFDEGIKEEDTILRELWANLLAQEITQSNVHPEYLMILNRLSSQDAIVLSHVARNDGAPVKMENLHWEMRQIDFEIKRLKHEIEEKHRASGGKYVPSKLGRGGRLEALYKQRNKVQDQITALLSVAELGSSFSHQHLQNIGLIVCIEDVYTLTELGKRFVGSVSDSLE